MMRSVWYVIAGMLAIVPVTADGRTYYTMTLEPENSASIEEPLSCSPKIGAGGSLLELGQRYSGKCEGSGIAPEIIGTQSYLNHLRFTNDPSYSGSEKTRTELAVTQRYFPFHERVYLGFRMMIPRGTNISDGSAFYLLQLWQCAGAAPIAGIRLDEGFSHTVEFMTRGDFRQGSFTQLRMLPGVWHRFIVSYVVSPRKGGEVKVWIDQNRGGPGKSDSVISGNRA